MEYYHVHIPRDGSVADLDYEQRYKIKQSIRSMLDDMSIEPISLPWQPNPKRPGDVKLTPWRLK